MQEGSRSVRDALGGKKTLDEFANTDHYWAIRP
jgi:hypothetical protein